MPTLCGGARAVMWRSHGGHVEEHVRLFEGHVRSCGGACEVSDIYLGKVQCDI